MPTRRALIALIGTALACPPVPVLASQHERVYRIGWVTSGSQRAEPYNAAFVQRLGELGLVEGRNLVIDFRSVQRSAEEMPALLTEIVRHPCDLLFMPGGETSIRVAVQGSRDIPIVIVAADYDPVATGHVASLSRPGGRVTGVAQMQEELPAKRLELLKTLLPKAQRVAVFTDVNTGGQLKVVQSAAKALGLTLQIIEFARAPYDYDRAFADAVRGKAEALFPLTSAFFVPGRRRICELALKHRLPSIFGSARWAETGALLSYGPDFSSIYRRAAEQVASILRGAKPADIPVEEHAQFELVLNLKTAKALGVAFPEAIRLRASRAID